MKEQDAKHVSLCFSLPAPVCLVLDRLSAAGHEGFLVGGCVRDFLRGVVPHDYDLTTSARPEEMHSAFAGLRMIDTGIKHGTITVLVEGMPMEVTTYRVDGDYHDSRHPEAVTFTTCLREDVARRDFTMNALAYHPSLGIHDYFGGCEDICNRLVRAVGEPHRRFEEDALRILRALRFSSVLGFSIEEKTAFAAHECAPLLTNISAERVHEELKKMLCGSNVQAVLDAYADVLAPVLPRWYQAAQGDLLRLTATLAALPADPVLRFAVFLSPLACTPAEADRVMADLRFDRRTRERVGKLLAHYTDACTGDLATMRRFVASLGGEDACLMLAWHEAEARLAKDAVRETALAEAREMVEGLLAQGSCCSVRDLAIGGADLISIGCRPGKELGQCLQAAFSAVLDGCVENEKNALLSFCQAWLYKEGEA